MRAMLWMTVLLAGCANPYQNLYEGISQQQEMQRTPAERAANPAPSYDRYRKDREQEAGQ